MALFDSVISETQEKFEIGDKADKLLSVLLAMIADEENGGFGGFLQTFKEAGLGDLASSWINTGANMPISYEQTESVFGEETLREMSDEVGLDYQTTTQATAFMTPHIIDELTPNGEIPNERGLLTMIGENLRETGADVLPPPETVDRVGTAAAADKISSPAAQSVAKDYSGNEENSILRILLPLILVGILIAVGYTVCGTT
jgi:uncharacterized protein YidB (DUF937 family)